MWIPNYRFLFVLIIIIAIALCQNGIYAQGYVLSYQSGEPLHNTSDVNRFYELNGARLFWFDSGYIGKRIALLRVIEDAGYKGLNKNDYHFDLIKFTAFFPNSKLPNENLDKIYTDAFVSYCNDLYKGCNYRSRISYDEVSSKYKIRDNNFILTSILKAEDSSSLLNIVASLEPASEDYKTLEEELKQQLSGSNKEKIQQLNDALDSYRWLSHFKFKKLIVVNIPSATLQYYEENKKVLEMKVVVGKPSSQTPRFAAYCDQIILYPYWNVLRNIAVNEFLPLFKIRPQLAEIMNIQVLDKDGHQVSLKPVSWSKYNKTSFPYHLRQSTGCNNALGVIKFNITDPFSVYLHDTNLKMAFSSMYRFYSHGCIRVENPISLATCISDAKFDTAFLKACIKNENSITQKIADPIPVIVLYMTSVAKNGKVQYYPNVYHLAD